VRLGTGTIIQSRGDVKGLTTGTSIWLAGSIGLAYVGGQYVIAAIVLSNAPVTLVAFGFIEARHAPRRHRGVEVFNLPARIRPRGGQVAVGPLVARRHAAADALLAPVAKPAIEVRTAPSQTDGAIK